jgi:hypothetical protein
MNHSFSHPEIRLHSETLQMKTPWQTIAISTVSTALAAYAQVATDSGLGQVSPKPTPLPAVTAEPTIPERAQIDQIFKETSLGQAADERRLHLEWRDLANRVVNDPDIVTAKKAAQTARTDLEKRQRLRDYYDLYYGRMRTLASSSEMKTALDKMRLAHVSLTSQPRVRAAEDSELPTPTPTPKKKKTSRLQKYENKH